MTTTVPVAHPRPATRPLRGVLRRWPLAAGLLGHAAWDVWHHRTNRVVTRSLAEFCVVLDTLLAAAMIVVAISG
ncbi:hypothetical protein [Jiangella rhizosphaerae]|uniref:Uncharacterized protein n=1 Tax=Jiangella rhizosphaerae TaxID=2293569 RepID=A0A418KIM6_9ACTN|nr:hypothetical protein [Jiangella rhizosphaerae]RIQ13601.1 hypothetical protein DY240_25855 [Jiangella rhizosphaerae]